MTQEAANKLKGALEQRLGTGTGVEMEAVRPGRYRCTMVSDAFSSVFGLARQDMAWAVADEVLTADEVLDIKLILTYDPAFLDAVELPWGIGN